MTSRESILSAVSRNQPSLLPLPEVPAFPFPESWRNTFVQRVEAIGGLVVSVATLADVTDQLGKVPEREAFWVTDNSALDCGHYYPSPLADGRAFDQVDRAILTGEFGVAENGAIWLSTRNLPHRALPFLCQHLVLIVAENTLVGTMHEAYQRLEGQRFDYGVFIAGPSKTADIEQSLVIGAHGPRSLTVFLLTTNESHT